MLASFAMHTVNEAGKRYQDDIKAILIPDLSISKRLIPQKKGGVCGKIGNPIRAC